jgi:arylsulfatase A-like enzyme
MKRLFLALLLVGANFLTPASGRAQTNPPPRYNVLFIISDDMRGDLPDAKLPNLDRLAASGVRFERGYCQFPLCNPARSSLFTGRAATHTGVLGNRTWFGDAHPEFVSLPRWFKEHGYVTARSGKVFHDGIDDADAWDEGGEARYLAGAGAETNFVKKMSQRTARQKAAGATNAVEEDAAAAFMDSEARTTHSDQTIVIPGDGHDDHDYRATTGALRLLEKYRGQPFFIAVGLSKPHSPPSAPQKFYDLYDVDKIPLPPDYAPRPTVPEGFPKLSIRPKNADLFIGRDSTPQTAREVIRAYLASCSYVDANVGRVLDELVRLHLDTNTIVVFTADHGYQLGEKGKWSKAGSLFEEGARVPFYLRVPGAPANGTANRRVVESLDFYPTLVDLCGLPRPDGLEGVSLAPLLQNPKAEWNRPAFTVWSENGKTLRGVSVRNEHWRYAEFEDGSAMLFDEDNDPHEMKNVANDPKNLAVRAELSKLVKNYWASFKPMTNAAPASAN